LAQDPALPGADHRVFGDEIRALAIRNANQAEQTDQGIEAILPGGIGAEADLDRVPGAALRRVLTP